MSPTAEDIAESFQGTIGSGSDSFFFFSCCLASPVESSRRRGHTFWGGQTFLAG